MKKVIFLTIIFCLFASFVYAEEETGLIQRIWRKLFKKPAAVEQKKIEPEKIEQNSEDGKLMVREQIGDEELTEEERQEQQDLIEELERMRGQQQLLTDIRNAQEAQKQTQNARPPR